VPKIEKILPYEMKFLVQIYSCLQNPWLGGCRLQIPVLSVLCPQLNLLNPSPEQNCWVRHCSVQYVCMFIVMYTVCSQSQSRRCPNMLSSLILQYLTFCLRCVFSKWSVILRLSDQWFLFSICPMRATLFCSVFLRLTSMSSYVTWPPCTSRALARK